MWKLCAGSKGVKNSESKKYRQRERENKIESVMERE